MQTVFGVTAFRNCKRGISAQSVEISGLGTDINISCSDSALCALSGTLTLSDDLCIFLPEGGYISSGRIFDSSGTQAKAVHIGGKIHTVTIDVGDLGDNISIEVPRGENFFTALNNAGAFETLDNMETDEYLFRDLATKPLSEFANETEFGDDAWELLSATVNDDMTVYAGFYTKIRNVSLTLTPPVIGTAVTVTEDEDIYTQTPSPVITLAADAHCTVSEGSAVWYAENYEGGMFEGTFEKGKAYLAEMLLMPDFGYWLDDNTAVSATGAEVVEADGRMSLFVTLSASPYLPGDANLDGRVDIRDVTAIQRHLAQLEPFSEEQHLPADTNGDGEINIVDATHLQKYLAEFEGVVLGKQ